MNLSQVEKNLVVFLDPFDERRKKEWDFIMAENESAFAILFSASKRKDADAIVCFGRGNLIKYFLLSCEWRLFRRNRWIRKVLFVNDGLMSCIFEVKNSRYYRSFAAHHLPKPVDLSKKIRSLIPVFIRAEYRYIVIEINDNSSRRGYEHSINGMEEPNFMFYSNAAGKLMLASGGIFQSGHGQLLKTTGNPDYGKTIVKEYNTISRISSILNKPGMVPRVRELFTAGDRFFFLEEYIRGRNLREWLYELGREQSFDEACSIIDRIGRWFQEYLSAFAGERKTLEHLYSPVVEMFFEHHGGQEVAMTLVRTAKHLLGRVDRISGGCVPTTSHNDLWPGNFLFESGNMFAIDWERATEERAPVFDFFWMIISASIEFHAGQSGVRDYSRSFRTFLINKDTVSIHAKHILCKFLKELGYSEENFFEFMFLFLMEWSIQGYAAIGRRTNMDDLAYRELINFVNSKATLVDA
jgi:hypothetical protein